MNLYEMTVSAKYLDDLLENGDIDERTVEDTIASMSVEDKLEDYCKVIRQFEADAALYREEEKRMAEKRKTAEKAVERLEAAVIRYMAASGKEKQKCGVFDLRVRHNKAVDILDESLIDGTYLIAQPTKIDKAAIRKVLLSGETVNGAVLKVSDSITIK